MQTTVADAISNQELAKFGKTQKFYVCLSKNSSGQGLRECAEKEENVTFFNRTECCERFNVVDSDDNIEIIQQIISKVPAHSVIVFDEVPLTSKVEKRKASYDWSLLKNERPEEVTAVVCLQPIKIAATFRPKTHNVIGPKDADIIQLTHQYRNTNNILGLVNQLCQEKLPIEYANVKVSPSHDVKGPEVTAISISDQSQAPDLRIWLCNQLQQELACKPSQVKMIHMTSTKELARAVVVGTVYENSVIQIDEFQGCETSVGVVFFGIDNNFSQLLEMCSRAQYKLILVISRENLLLDEIRSVQTEITVLNIEDVDKRPALPMATENGNVTLVKQLLDCGASTSDRNADNLAPLVIATEKEDVALVKELLHFGASTKDTNKEGHTPLLIATERGNVALARQLLKYEASTKESNADGLSPLMIAVGKGYVTLVKQLLESGASHDEKNADGLTPLLMATENSNVALVRHLLECGASTRDRNADGLTPLVIAAKQGNSDICKELVNHGADMEDTDQEGNTPLLVATKSGNFNLVRQLLESGASVRAQNKEGLTSIILLLRQLPHFLKDGNTFIVC